MLNRVSDDGKVDASVVVSHDIPHTLDLCPFHAVRRIDPEFFRKLPGKLADLQKIEADKVIIGFVTAKAFHAVSESDNGRFDTLAVFLDVLQTACITSANSITETAGTISRVSVSPIRRYFRRRSQKAGSLLRFGF